MSTRKLSNVSRAEFQAFLELAGCKYIKTEGGHEKWTRADLFRPIMFQTHIDPVPEFIVKNNLRNFPYSKNDFFDILEHRKKVVRNGSKFTLDDAKKRKAE